MAAVDINTLYNSVVERPLQIYQVFKDFFGEERVDIQKLVPFEVCQDCKTKEQIMRMAAGTYGQEIDILVYWPTVRVTNEHDRYEDIQDLYAKISINYSGILLRGFALNRATYSRKHIYNDYMHSHVRSIPYSDFTQFQYPCTGSGPINSTMATLYRTYSLDIWRLFCLELDKYVQVESVAGVPYHHLESLSNVTSDNRRASLYQTHQYFRVLGDLGLNPENREAFAEFTVYLIKRKVLKFAFDGYSFTIAMSPKEFYTTISNEFISWYNKKFAHSNSPMRFCNSFLKEVRLINGKFFRESRYGGSSYNIAEYEGKPVCTFKGNTINIHISDLNNVEEEPDRNIIRLLSEEISGYILLKIINLLNFKYGKIENTPNERVQYL